jgi:hypothetical protein
MSFTAKTQNKNFSTIISHGIIQYSFGDLFPKVTSLNNLKNIFIN